MPSASDVLDLLGLLLLAAGLGFLTHGAVGFVVTGTVPVGAGLTVAAVVVLLGSWLSDRRRGEDG